MARGGAASTVEQEAPGRAGASCSSGRHCRSDAERQDQRVDPAGEPARSARPLKRCQSWGRQSTGGVVTGPVCRVRNHTTMVVAIKSSTNPSHQPVSVSADPLTGSVRPDSCRRRRRGGRAAAAAGLLRSSRMLLCGGGGCPVAAAARAPRSRITGREAPEAACLAFLLLSHKIRESGRRASSSSLDARCRLPDRHRATRSREAARAGRYWTRDDCCAHRLSPTPHRPRRPRGARSLAGRSAAVRGRAHQGGPSG